jgi:hypothetical protein
MPGEVACASVVIACDSAPLFPFAATSRKCVEMCESEKCVKALPRQRCRFQKERRIRPSLKIGLFLGEKNVFFPLLDIVERGRDIVERDKLYLRLSPFFYSAENKLTWERHFLC